MSDDAKAAAERLLQSSGLHVADSRQLVEDILTVARYALAAEERERRLRGELHAYHIREALQWSKTAPWSSSITVTGARWWPRFFT